MGIHAQHRQRMKERFLKDGLDHFPAHEALELLLFYAIPIKDTNLLAHQLINRFGTFHGVLDAGYGELCTVKGLGPHCATLVSMMPHLFRFYRVSQARSKNLLLRKPAEIAEFLKPQFLGRSKENMFLLCLDDGGGILYGDVIFEGTINAVAVHTREILKLILNVDATNVILAHNHPRGLAIPSQEDMKVTDEIRQALKYVGARLVDHFIFAGEDFISLREAGYFDRLTEH